MVVAVGRWSLLGGGRLLRFDCTHESDAVQQIRILFDAVFNSSCQISFLDSFLEGQTERFEFDLNFIWKIRDDEFQA